MTTTNGTRAILASLDADRVLVAGFVNRQATIEALKADGRPIHLVCAGTDGHVSLEDTMLAGPWPTTSTPGPGTIRRRDVRPMRDDDPSTRSWPTTRPRSPPPYGMRRSR